MPGPSDAASPGAGPWRDGTAAEGFTPFPDAAVDSSVTSRFLAVAARHPDRCALRGPSGTWTYSQLADRVQSLAAGVRDLLGRDTPTPVGILADHDAPLVGALLGVIAAGHIVVVLDPQAPVEHTRQILTEAGWPIVLVDAHHRELAESILAGKGGAAPVPLDSVVGDEDLPLPDRGPRDPLMLAFTSGTTGVPKGAVITHGVVTNLVRGATNALGIGPDDRMPMLFPVSLAVAAYPLFLPLLNGGTLVTLDVRGVGLAPVADFLVDEEITLAYLAPTVLRFLVDALAGRDFPALRLVALGGEIVDAEVVRLAADLLGPEWIANGFGTTETGVITLYLLDPSETPSGSVPAGYPVPGVELHILDEQGRELPPGESGEVAVAGPHLFPGYWGHPDLSSTVLSEDPGGRAGWQLYRTGDLGRLDSHGALVVLGRLDTKVKVRGRFVVLGDVEADLLSLPEVSDAAVVADVDGDHPALTAHLAISPGATWDPRPFRERLLESREAYRVPTHWVRHESLPQLPNGKTDRRALAGAHPAPAAVTNPSPAAIPNPAAGSGSGEEQVLLAIWRRLLPAGEIGLHDDFTHLGGDSLLAAQMLIAAEADLGVVIPMGELVHARTISDLAQVVRSLREAAGRRGSPDTTVCVTPAAPGSTAPRLWFVPDLQGSAYRVRHLADALGLTQELWSFESPLIRGEPNPFHSLDTFAARLLTDLRAVQPAGPYRLAGYSFGGICAYEMARQLRRDGEEVAFLGIIDVGPGYRGPGWGHHRPPPRPWFGVAKPPEPGSSLGQRIGHYREMARHPARLARHLTVRTGLAARLDPVRYRWDLHRHGRVRGEWRLWYAWDEHWKLSAVRWDRAKTYDSRVDLFWASDTPSADSSMGWAPLVADLEIHRFDGDHDSLLEPRCAPALAEALRSALARHPSPRSGSAGEPPVDLPPR